MESSTELASMPSRPEPTARRRRRLLPFIAAGAPLLLGGCQLPGFGAKPGVTTTSVKQYHLWQGFMVTGLVVGGFTLFLIIYAALRYRRRSNAIPRQTQYNTFIEVLYTVIPTIIVGFLFYATIVVENPVTAIAQNPSTRITVNAFQWGWQFKYEGHKNWSVFGQTTQSPILVLPANETVQINLVSLDVVHGFYVKAFNFSRYAQPGHPNLFDFNIKKTGLYPGQCTQLCGLYHSLMYFRVNVVSPADYQAWLATQDATHSGPITSQSLPNGNVAKSITHTSIKTIGSTR